MVLIAMHPNCTPEKRAERATRHGKCYSRAYHSWYGMFARCGNPKNKDFHNYGGRGIRVCERWTESFENFYADMGDPPDNHSLDRIDRDGNYEPSNCRWADPKTQARNSRKIRWIEFKGETKPLADWAAQIGITSSRLCGRIKSMGLDRALSIPKTIHTITARSRACKSNEI